MLLGFACPLLALRFGAPVTLGGAIAIGAGYALAVQIAFNSGVILPFVAPIIALLVGAVAAVMTVLSLDLSAAAFGRERVRDVFARFVPPSVVDEVLASSVDDDLRLAGERLQATIVTCDIRDFTAFAELCPAEQVIEVLNRYLSEIARRSARAGRNPARLSGRRHPGRVRRTCEAIRPRRPRGTGGA